jgi:peptide/nickel transport system substrate-binding protein
MRFRGVGNAVLLLALLALLVAACARSADTSPAALPQADGQTPPPSARSRPLVMIARSDVPSLGSKPLQGLGLTSGTAIRLFNAGFALADARGNPYSYLAERLPQLNSDTWRVFPDGRMETTYRLKPNLTWHDGRSLSADDFVFSWQVYAVPDLGQAASPPSSLVERVTAPDPRTIVITWRQPYAQAGVLEAGSSSTSPAFPALPRHILESPFEAAGQAASWEAFIAHPHWTSDYIGLGPYRLDRWETGAFFEGAAFDGHALGRPRIDRIRVTFIPDFNATLANMLSGDAHITVDNSLRFQQAILLKREWAPRNGGTVLVYPGSWRWTHIQQRQELANPPSLRDARARKALAHAVDKPALNEVLFEGEGVMGETPVAPNTDYFPMVDRAAITYPFDLRRSEQLMAEAGFTKATDGTFTHPASGRFSTVHAVLQSPQNETEMGIMAATWRQAGFDVRESVWSAAQGRDFQLRNLHSGTFATGGGSGEQSLVEHRTSELPRPENRWDGPNRGGWTNPEFDRFAEAYTVSLDRDERVRLLAEMARIFTEEVAVISMYFNAVTTAHVAALKGPQPVVLSTDVAWNIHEWEFF